MRLRIFSLQTLLPSAALLAALLSLGLRGSAVPSSPISPSSQALASQNAFEQVAMKLRPSVVYIQCQSGRSAPVDYREGAAPGSYPYPPKKRKALPDEDAPNDPSEPSEPADPSDPGGPAAPRGTVASGSGVIIRSDGYILTNDHVVAGATHVTVRLQDGREFDGQVRRDFRSDLALIKIEASGLPAAEFADSDQIQIGQWAIAFGSPFGLSDTMTVGIVSALHRQQAIGTGSEGRFYASLLQTDASINPGNSGGPLVDIYGRIVGINVAIESPSGASAGIGFAIPANTARYIMGQLLSQGHVTRGYLGVNPVTPTYAEKQRYGVTQGALLRTVSPDSPGAQAGLQTGDLILRFNGQEIRDDAHLRELVAQTAPGARIALVVKREGGERTVNVTVGTASETPEEPAPSPRRKPRLQEEPEMRRKPWE